LKLFEHMFDHVLVEGDLDPHPPPGHRQLAVPIFDPIFDPISTRSRPDLDPISTRSRPRQETTVRRYDDPVEVRTGADQDPDQFLWRGRLWQVREVVAHWVETGAWWARRSVAGSLGDGAGDAVRDAVGDGDLLREREVWRVAAARGRVAAQQTTTHTSEHDLGYGVFDLVFSWSEGSWQLVRAMD
jgi:hypothetical protein